MTQKIRENRLPKNMTALRLGASALVLTAAMAEPAIAQEGAAQEEVTQDERTDEDGNVIVVTGIRSSIASANEIKRNTDGIVDALVAEDIGKFSDQNIGEALQRVTGISLQRRQGEGTTVSVRGIGPSLNLVQLNGATLASGSDNQAVDLSHFSADVLSEVQVAKTFSADEDEGSLGGTVRLQTARPLELTENRRAFEIQARYQDQSEEWSPGVKAALTQSLFDGTFGIAISGTYEERSTRVDSVRGNTWEARNIDGDNTNGVDLDGDGDLDDGWAARRVDQEIIVADTERIGANFTAQWQPDEHTDIVANFNYASFDRFQELGNWAWTWGNARRNDQDLLSPIANIATTVIDPTTFTITRLDAFQNVIFPNGDLRTDQNSRYQHRNVRDVQNTETITYSIQAERQFGRLNLAVAAGRSEAEQTSPEQFNANWWILLDDGGYDFTSGVAPVIFGSDPLSTDPEISSVQVRQRNVEDTNEYIQIDADYDLDLGWVFATLQAGFKYSERTKDRFDFQRTYRCRNNTQCETELGPQTVGITLADAARASWPFGADFLSEYDVPGLDRQFTTNDPALLEQIFRPAGGFDVGLNPSQTWVVSLETKAFYGLVDFEAFDGRLRGDVGVRYVDWRRNSIGGANDLNIVVDGEEVLPGVNLRLDATDDIVLRFAYNKTIAHPTLSSVSPGLSYNAFTGAASGTNPFLEPYRATNFDFSAEWYYSDTGILSVGFFYKDIEDFILQQLTQGTLIDVQGICAGAVGEICREPNTGLPPDQAPIVIFDINAPANGRQGEIWGIETTAQFDLSFMDGRIDSPFLNYLVSGLGGFVNYTFSPSELDYSLQAGDDPILLPFVGNSKHTVNLVAFWEQGGHSVRLAYNYRSDYLDSNNRQTDVVWVEGFGQLDFSASAAITDNVSITFQGINLTKSFPYQFATETFEGNAQDGNVPRDRFREVTQYDRIFRIGVRARF